MLLGGTYWSLVHWTLEGVEVGLTALPTSVVVLQSFVDMESGRTRQLAAMAACLIALEWTRLEMCWQHRYPPARLHRRAVAAHAGGHRVRHQARLHPPTKRDVRASGVLTTHRAHRLAL